MRRTKFIVFLAFFWAARAAAHGVSPTEIVIGSSLPLSGPLGPYGRAFVHAANVVYESTNRSGGVHGRKIRHLSMDDEYVPKNMLKNVDRLLVREKVFAIVGSSGAAGLSVSLPLINRDLTPMLFSLSASEFLFKPVQKNIFNLRVTFGREAQDLTDFLVKEKKVRKFAIFYQDDSFGVSGRDGLKAALGKHRLHVVQSASHGREGKSFEKQVEAVQKSGAEVVFLSTNVPPAAEFIRAAERRKYFPIYAGISAVSPLALQKEIGKMASVIYVASPIPLPGRCKLALCQQFLKDVKGDEKFWEFAFAGYMGARLFVEAVKLSGPDLTKEKLFASLEGMKNYDLGGISVNYSAHDHQGLDSTIRYKIEHGQLIVDSQE